MKDAVGICLQKMADFQLAIVLARLIEGEGPVFEYIMNSYVLPLAQETGRYFHVANFLGDSSLASIALWQLKKYSDSISALLPNTPTSQSPSSAPSTPQSIRMSQVSQNPPTISPSVFLLFEEVSNEFSDNHRTLFWKFCESVSILCHCQCAHAALIGS